MVGPGFIRAEKERQSGLVDLDSVRALDLVDDEDEVQIYELARPAPLEAILPTAADSADSTSGGTAGG